ncbi:hypothetical protein ELS24_10505 [Achromobacter spanius]|uniref:hypothetical protein n=1 Tax=Achromobacter spanius TaxID=217203 RepID=UPI000F8FA56B|nr:hypothetical protein [Achromobacter spanius]AZS78838.1 hypothetical protein ELS24_10505 [Achromobacter spanius]
MWKRHFPVMNEAGAEGGGGGGGDAAAAGSDASSTVAQDPAAAAATAKVAEAGADQSLLSKGAGTDTSTPGDWIPEKFQIKNEAGDLDIEASARKLAESYGHLEKRNGSADAPPKTHTDYAITPPDAFKDIDVRSDPDMGEFLESAHKAGMSQKQIDVVMDAYFKMAPKLAQGAAEFDQEQATEHLQAKWGTGREFERHAGLAHAATSAAIQKSGVSMEEVEQSGLGNHPVFLRLMAGLGSEFQEDRPVGGHAQRVTEDSVREMELSEAYRNPRHPQHDAVSKQVRAYYERRHGTEAVM